MRYLCESHVNHGWLLIGLGRNVSAKVALATARQGMALKCDGLDQLQAALKNTPFEGEKIGNDETRAGAGVGAGLRRHYDTLDVQHNASTAEVRRAYRRQARKLHPDKVMASSQEQAKLQEAQERFLLLVEAYRILSGVATCAPAPIQ